MTRLLINDAISKLQHDLILIQIWYFNEIFMNSSKTKIMLIKSPHKPFQEIIEKVKSHTRICFSNRSYEEGSCICQEKYVGMLIDPKLKFDSHIDVLAGKLRTVSYRFGFAFKTTLKQICNIKKKKFNISCICIVVYM